MSKRVKAILITAIVIVGVAAIFLIAIFGATFANINSCISEQHKRLENLRALYENGTFSRVDEHKFCDFDLDKAVNGDIKLVDVQFLGTHNSYKREKSPLEKFYGKFSRDLAEGNYAFETPTDQLNAGIRSMEFDLYCKTDKDRVTFHSFHIGYADMSSNAFDFAACLDEINLWSVNNPNHLPVTVIIELKERGEMFPYKTVGKEQLGQLDALIKDRISNLYTPSQAFAGYENLNEMRAYDDSPTLKETMGKVLFILHRGEQTENYIRMDETYQMQSMFPSGYFWFDNVVGKHQFVIINNHGYYEGTIEECGGRKNGYFFRIMLDSVTTAKPSMDDVLGAIATGANICSTNRPPRLSVFEGYESVYFAPDGKTVKLVDGVNLQ